MVAGGCHCGAIRYELTGEPGHSAICHCSDCRKASGAPMVGWALFAREQISISGEPAHYRSSADAERLFCSTCGSGLFYINEAVFPGQIDVQIATLDDQSAFPPQIHIQFAEATPWMAGAHEMPRFDRYPGA